VSHGWEDTVARLLVVQAEGFERLPMERVDALIEQACAQLRGDPALAAAALDATEVDPAHLDGMRQAGNRVLASLQPGASAP
jgi:hypothetical protein